MSFALVRSLLTVCLCAVGVGAVHAGQEVSVGRVDLVLAEDGWNAYALNDKGNSISGEGTTIQQAAGTQVVVRGSPDREIDAVLIVRANASGRGRSSGFTYSGNGCEAKPGVFSEGDEGGPAARSYRCLNVWAPGRVNLDAEVNALLDKEGWKMPSPMSAITAVQYANSSSFATFIAVIRPELLMALPAPAEADVESLPTNVSAASVRWARQLQKAVSDSVYSFRGKLPVPALGAVDSPSSVKIQ